MTPARPVFLSPELLLAACLSSSTLIPSASLPFPTSFWPRRAAASVATTATTAIRDPDHKHILAASGVDSLRPGQDSGSSQPESGLGQNLRKSRCSRVAHPGDWSATTVAASASSSSSAAPKRRRLRSRAGAASSAVLVPLVSLHSVGGREGTKWRRRGGGGFHLLITGLTFFRAVLSSDLLVVRL